MREVRWYFAVLLFLTLGGSVYVWLAEVPVPPPPTLDISRASAAVAEAINLAYEDVVQQPDSGSSRGKLGMLLFAHDYRQEALECFRQAVRLEPSQFKWRYFQAILEEDHDPIAAAESYSRADRYRTKIHPPLYQRLGNVLTQLNRFDEARRNYQLAIEFVPKSPYPLLGLGRLELKLNDIDAAMSYFGQALELDQTCQETLYEMIRVLRMIGDVTTAANMEESAASLAASPWEIPDEFLLEVEQLDRSDNRPIKLADQYMAQNRLKEAAELLELIISVSPEAVRPRINLGYVLLRQRQFGVAIPILRETVQRFPQESSVHVALATAFELNEQFAAAAQSYQAAAALRMDFAEAHYRAGRNWLQVGELDRAQQQFERAIETNRSLIRAYHALTRLHVQKNEKMSATEVAQAALRIAQKDPATRRLAAELGLR